MPVERRNRQVRASAESLVSSTGDDSDTAGDSDTGGAVSPDPPAAAGHSKGDNKLEKIKKRVVFGALLLAFLSCVIMAGHFWCLLLVLITQMLMFRELVNVRYSKRRFKEVPIFRSSQWGWFYAALGYSLGKSFLDPDRQRLITSPTILQLLPYCEFMALLLYSLMLITTVLTLHNGFYKYQVGQLAWTIAVIVIAVVQVHSFTANILNGLFWFLFPLSLVICNDTMAYFCGMSFGRKFIRRTFLSISPNKTWEGYIGGGLCTIFFAFATPRYYISRPWLVCPCDRLNVFSFDALSLTCELPAVFLPVTYELSYLPGAPAVTLLPIQLHALCLGVFASVVAPFGGFFASGIKRAYHLDDFASIIPGHGGVFDRVDCQLIMGLATQTYYVTFVGSSAMLSTAYVLSLAASLKPDDQVKMYQELGKSLKAQGLIRSWL